MIVTTRSRTLGTDLVHGEPCVEVQPFSPPEAEILLRTKLGKDALITAKKNSEKLLQILGYIPPAITQAAAFIRCNRTSLSEYCATLEKDEKNLIEHLSQELRDARRQRGTPNSIYRTWKITFDYLRMYEPRAARILSLAAMFENQGIPRALLRPLLDTDVDFQWRLEHLMDIR